MEDGINTRIERNNHVSDGIKNQIGGVQEKNKPKTPVGGESQMSGIRSKSYYLDVIFVQFVLLLLLYGICVFVVPKLS
ncbi:MULTISPECIES: hypothetical protein [unclassified Methanosarcina]|uniref:hypothetical protein n=1 Tax=unclassified Methanosarcina TaxID=2644672 RepID=UPI00061585B7|nr:MULTISPECIES: hypothetical protein [unclassified Methanosarcina]AKB18983.1 hypothetical protein MSWHS_2120 [Methanosarcina sp. WWM596]AKB23143.1 hypothetical protein MSWH1_2872 [Methanosarcina sp. WH1]